MKINCRKRWRTEQSLDNDQLAHECRQTQAPAKRHLHVESHSFHRLRGVLKRRKEPDERHCHCHKPTSHQSIAYLAFGIEFKSCVPARCTGSGSRACTRAKLRAHEYETYGARLRLLNFSLFRSRSLSSLFNRRPLPWGSDRPGADEDLRSIDIAMNDLRVYSSSTVTFDVARLDYFGYLSTCFSPRCTNYSCIICISLLHMNESTRMGCGEIGGASN
jgi:hypothetical protein